MCRREFHDLSRTISFRYLFLAKSIVLESLHCLLAVRRRREDVVKAKLTRKDVLHDVYSIGFFGMTRKAVENICCGKLDP